jgi:ABC-2 type transport system ATP-binding protein
MHMPLAPGAIDAERDEPILELVADPATEGIRVAGVTKSWPRLPAPVLDSVDLSVEGGTSLWIGGRNGIGKTTLLRVIGGIIEPDAGSVSVFGLDARRRRRRFNQAVGFLSAGDRGMYARLTIWQQLDLTARLALIPRGERRARVQRVFEDFGLAEYGPDRRLDRLSMGQRQRVRLAMAFLPGPAAVLLDEPRNSLDSDGYAVLEAAVRGLLARGGVVVWCSPLGEQTGMSFDSECILENGKLVQA